MLDADSETSRLGKIRAKAKADYYFFCKEVLGYSRMSPVPHQETCDHIKDPTKLKKLTLMPRGSFKSSVITVGGSLHEIQENPNIRILIASETQKNATTYVKEIKGHLEGNQKFRALFGDLVNKNDTWRDFEFTVNSRTRISKECTVTAGSLEKGFKTGMHYDLIILDDVVSQNNTQTPEQIQKTLDYYKLLMSILDPGGRIWICGTRWNVFDLYGWILDPANGQLAEYGVLIKRAESPDGKLLMPNVLTKKFLDEQKKTQGEAIYSHQYNNEAFSNEMAVFKPEWVKLYDKPPGGLIFFITIDCAIAKESGSDYTAIIVNGVDMLHRWYIHEAIEEKLDLPEVIDRLFTLADKYQPLMCIGMQKYLLEKALKSFLNHEMGKRGKYLPIKEVQTDNRVSKETRIKALQPKFQAGEVFMKREHAALIMQTKMYPQVKHDDLLDALKDQLSITFASDKPLSEPEDAMRGLTQAERRIWEGVKELGRRRVRQTNLEEL